MVRATFATILHKTVGLFFFVTCVIKWSFWLIHGFSMNVCINGLQVYPTMLVLHASGLYINDDISGASWWIGISPIGTLQAKQYLSAI